MSDISKLITTFSSELVSKEIQREGEEKKRIVVFADNASEKLKDSVYKAHQDSLPRDWIFGTYADILQRLEEYEVKTLDDVEEVRSELVDSMVDIYTADLTAWLADSISNVEYLTQAMEEYGQPQDGFKLLALAQYMAIDEVFGYVYELLSEEA